MSQAQLFPLKVVALHCTAGTTAHLAKIALCEDSHDYAVKEVTAFNPELPATESLCYRLAGACGIAVPASATLLMPDGTMAFGSRFEGGISQVSLLPIAEKELVIRSCAVQLSGICSVDLFIANIDRHADNALYRKNTISGDWSVIAMDYSLAMWVSGFPTNSCSNVANSGNTATFINWLKGYNVYDKSRGFAVAAALLAIEAKTITSWINELPSAWVTHNVSAFAGWWDSPARADRISELMALL